MYLRNNQLTSDDPKMLIPMPDQPPDPLAPTTVWPNYMLLVSYPLFNSNARILFTKQMNRQGMGTGIEIRSAQLSSESVVSVVPDWD
eukprot:gene1127-663_t